MTTQLDKHDLKVLKEARHLVATEVYKGTCPALYGVVEYSSDADIRRRNRDLIMKEFARFVLVHPELQRTLVPEAILNDHLMKAGHYWWPYVFRHPDRLKALNAFIDHLEKLIRP